MGTHCFYFGSYFSFGISHAPVKHSSLAGGAEAERGAIVGRARRLPRGLSAEGENRPPALAPLRGLRLGDGQGADCRRPGSEQGKRAEFECGPYRRHRTPTRPQSSGSPCLFLLSRDCGYPKVSREGCLRDRGRAAGRWAWKAPQLWCSPAGASCLMGLPDQGSAGRPQGSATQFFILKQRVVLDPSSTGCTIRRATVQVSHCPGVPVRQGPHGGGEGRECEGLRGCSWNPQQLWAFPKFTCRGEQGPQPVSFLLKAPRWACGTQRRESCLLCEH